MLISVEHELPAVSLIGDQSIRPEIFEGIWAELSSEGWRRDGRFGISRVPRDSSPDAKKPEQAMTTDTGPTVEIAPSPARTVQEIEIQLTDLRSVIMPKLYARNIAILGSGIHPNLGASEAEYMLYRTPRKSYDYAIDPVQGRGWNHGMMLNIAAIQEVVDVPVDMAPSMVCAMHRLAGLFLFLFRNDPDYRSCAGNRLSVRPYAWEEQVRTSRFPEDRHKVGVPEKETGTWSEYLRLLWDMNPMFVLGTKTGGLVYIPEHPTFMEFLSSGKSWLAKRIDSGETEAVTPDIAHVAYTDWSYMGFARLRLFWRDNTTLLELVDTYRSANDAEIAKFMADHLDKVLLENRSCATQPPGSELMSLALVVGLLANFGAVMGLLRQHQYSAWRELAHAAEYVQFDSCVSGIHVPSAAEDILALADAGLRQRGYGEETYLEGLRRRVRNRESHSELMMKIMKKEGMEAVIKSLRYQ